MPEPAAVSPEDLGAFVAGSSDVTNDPERYMELRLVGNTYTHRSLLAKHCDRWDPGAKAWCLSPERAKREVAFLDQLPALGIRVERIPLPQTDFAESEKTAGEVPPVQVAETSSCSGKRILDDADLKAIDRGRKLLALAESTSPEEASSAKAMALQVLAKRGLDVADLREPRGGAAPANPLGNPFEGVFENFSNMDRQAQSKATDLDALKRRADVGTLLDLMFFLHGSPSNPSWPQGATTEMWQRMERELPAESMARVKAFAELCPTQEEVRSYRFKAREQYRESTVTYEDLHRLVAMGYLDIPWLSRV